MKRKKLRQLAKEINHGNEVNIKFTFTPADTFCYNPTSNQLEISSFFHQLSKSDIVNSLTHELGHMNTYAKVEALYITTYSAEYEANRWALYRLDELGWKEQVTSYEFYLKELAMMEIADEEDEEYQEAAEDLLLEMELI